MASQFSKARLANLLNEPYVLMWSIISNHIINKLLHCTEMQTNMCLSLCFQKKIPSVSSPSRQHAFFSKSLRLLGEKQWFGCSSLRSQGNVCIEVERRTQHSVSHELQAQYIYASPANTFVVVCLFCGGDPFQASLIL